MSVGGDSFFGDSGIGSLQNVSLTVSGGATGTFSGVTSITRSDLYASSGGKLLFPAATSYASNTSAFNYHTRALGNCSPNVCSCLPSFTGGIPGATVFIFATAGGEV